MSVYVLSQLLKCRVTHLSIYRSVLFIWIILATYVWAPVRDYMEVCKVKWLLRIP